MDESKKIKAVLQQISVMYKGGVTVWESIQAEK